MEEGPEPQELIERTVEHHEHAQHHQPASAHRLSVAPAITAATLAVLAAIGSLLSGHAANEAILAQSKATDQWAYYQAKSTKGHIYEADKSVVSALAHLQGISPEKVNPELERFEKAVGQYSKEKEEIKQEATRLENEREHEFSKHQYYSLAVAAFQVGIVLASISILVRLRAIYALSLVAGAAGVLLLIVGLSLREAAAAQPSTEAAALVDPTRGSLI